MQWTLGRTHVLSYCNVTFACCKVNFHPCHFCCTAGQRADMAQSTQRRWRTKRCWLTKTLAVRELGTGCLFSLQSSREVRCESTRWRGSTGSSICMTMELMAFWQMKWWVLHLDCCCIELVDAVYFPQRLWGFRLSSSCVQHVQSLVGWSRLLHALVLHVTKPAHCLLHTHSSSSLELGSQAQAVLGSCCLIV